MKKSILLQFPGSLRKFQFLIFLVVLSPVFKAKAAALSGTYTICSSGCSYSSFSGAISDLNTNGISGAVTFNVSAGTYTASGPATLNAITGASATNTVTFNGAGMNSTIWSGSTLYLLYLKASYVTFKNMQFNSGSSSGGAIYMSSSSYCSVTNCRFVLLNYATTSYYEEGIEASDINNLTVSNCRFEGGYYSCRYQTSSNCSFLNNKFVGFYYAALFSNNSSGTGQDTETGNIMDSAVTSTPYGIYSAYENGATITNNILLGCELSVSYPNYTSTKVLSDITNNIVKSPSSSAAFPFYILATYNNIRVSHNTIYASSSSTVYDGVYITSTATANVEVMNNIFDIEGTANDHAIYIAGAASGYSKLDGNDYYTGSTSALSDVAVFSTGYLTLSSLRSALKSNGFEQNASSMKPAYVSTAKNDFHLDKTVANPFGPYAGVDKDIDGDSRCQLFPSAGADESTYGKNSMPTAKYYGPDTVYYGSPATFYNSAKPGAAETYKWYINNLPVSDSIDLVTTVTSGASIKVTLAVRNCAGLDSSPIVFPVAYPSNAPVADFIADKNVIKQGDIIHFTDASTHNPSAWQWSITPGYTMINGANTWAYKFLDGTTAASQNPVIQFLGTGSYKVCLTATNTLKSGKTGTGSLCRSGYINVVSSVNLGTVSSINQPTGYLYDNGGPNGYYKATGTGAQVQGITIDGCADSTYLVFKSFGIYCGFDYVNVYDGKDNGGTLLNKKTCAGGTTASSSSGSTGYGPGYTGGGSYATCPYACMPNLTGSAKTDTFRAGKQMYVEMKMYPGILNPGSGFEAYWWTKPTTMTKPKASFITTRDANHDSICQFGSIGFINKSTGANISNLWDLDNNLADGFESTQQNPVWDYPFPGMDTIYLVVVNCGGADTFTKVVKVYKPTAPKAGFTADDENPALNHAVFLTSDQGICVDAYKWRIYKTYKSAGDTGTALYVLGTSAASANPAVEFTDTGYYTVEQVVDNVSGMDSIVKKAYLQVRDGYCVPGVGTLLSGIGISYVGFQNIDNKTSQGVSDYTSYYNDKAQSAYMQQGFSYTVTIKRDSAFFSSINRTIYFDWQHNGNFVRAASDSNNSSSATWHAKFAVPKNAVIGATVMRVAANLGSYANNPCGTNQYGEYEDYRVYVTSDTVAPVITLKGSDTISVERGKLYTEPGYKALNSVGNDITSSVKVTTVPSALNLRRAKPGTYKLAYNVIDSLGNKAVTKYRYLVVTLDITPPVLQVDGPDTTIVPVDKYSSAYAVLPKVQSAYDAADSVASVSISPQNIPVNKVDTVKVQYTATDSSGNQAIVYRYVIVKDNIAPVLTLKGSASVTIGLNATYKDAGVKDTDNYYPSSVLDPLVVPINGVDVTKPGTYLYTYKLTDPSGNVANPVSRKVIVVDTIPPVITIDGRARDTMEVFSTYNDPGVTVKDNYYTNNVVTKKGTFYTNFPNARPTKLGTYNIIYVATDGSGNSDSIARLVTVVDTVAPKISLLGDSLVTICRWANYKDTGYSVSDNYYTSVKIDTEGTFITQGGTQLPGIYSLRFRAMDGSGNFSYSAYRILVVLSDTSAECKSGIKEGLSLDKYIRVYPNPTTGMLTISADLPYQRNVQVYITNSLGQRVGEPAAISLSKNTFSIDLSSQAAGLYMLNIVSAKEKITRQIMLVK